MSVLGWRGLLKLMGFVYPQRENEADGWEGAEESCESSGTLVKRTSQ